MADSKHWKVGELARATGLTVRTLHHWDDIGLVTPERASSGHRCYTGADIARLYQVVTLKRMGLGLDEIVALLSDEDPQPQATLRRHLQAVERELWHLGELREQLVRVLAALDRPGAEADTELLEVIEKMTMFESRLTEGQRAWFARRRAEVGDATWEAALAEWPELIAKVRVEMAAGTDPADPKVQHLVARWDELAELFLGNDAEIRVAAGRAWQDMWAENEDQLRRSAKVAPPDMWDYVQRAREVG